MPLTVRQALIFIAGYVTNQLPNLSNQLEEEDTVEEYVKYGQFTEQQNRGGLSIPRDRLSFFAYYCYIAFYLQQEIQGTCQKRYLDYFIEINNYVDLVPRDISKVCSILSNTFLNNWSKKQNEETRCKNNDMIKRAKLSV